MRGGIAVKRKIAVRAAGILLAGIMTVSTAALPARSSAFVSVCAGADVTKPVLRTVWKTGINALSGAFPMLRQHRTTCG